MPTDFYDPPAEALRLSGTSSANQREVLTRRGCARHANRGRPIRKPLPLVRPTINCRQSTAATTDVGTVATFRNPSERDARSGPVCAELNNDNCQSAPEQGSPRAGENNGYRGRASGCAKRRSLRHDDGMRAQILPNRSARDNNNERRCLYSRRVTGSPNCVVRLTCTSVSRRCRRPSRRRDLPSNGANQRGWWVFPTGDTAPASAN
uniref:Uncharacterized protein n=1 Tax=Trichuris muris TaxID=70415 RepID=A0A5S6Q860_TRIMR